ncbi:odorant receptor 131-2-like [Megalobrama amblycephala]|uniref:odorant receptor 131-2-like n=1 Tax=Megalobrama amblycephala TaxID=75352 RepID=UPI0020147692|nr:odorant receptor 131-2-like [Megalobrama amblycephala]
MNLTVNNLSSTSSLRPLNEKPLLVQVVVGILLYVNGLMIFTFLKKETFRDTRYILFAQTLFVDSALMLLAYLTLMGMFYQYPMHMIPCCIICTIMNLLSLCSPITLVAMCLERYVAICLPLRHASISTPKNTFIGLLIIWSVSFVLPLFILIVYFAYLPPGVMFSYVACSVEIMLQVKWLADTRAATLQLLFIMMLCFIVSTYIKIMITARSASSENKKSSNKGLKTVLLHGIQLLLCMVQLITPYIEMPLWKLDVMLFVNVRYSNFILFVILPRCLSPLVYGLRDKKFYNALRYYAFCGICNQQKIRDGKTLKDVLSISIHN